MFRCCRPGEDAPLARELGCDQLRHARLAHELDGHRALERAIRALRAVDAAHAALAQQILHPIGADLLGRRRVRAGSRKGQRGGKRIVHGERGAQQLAHVREESGIVCEGIQQPLLALLRRPGERILQVLERESFVLEIHPHGISCIAVGQSSRYYPTPQCKRVDDE